MGQGAVLTATIRACTRPPLIPPSSNRARPEQRRSSAVVGADSSLAVHGHVEGTPRLHYLAWRTGDGPPVLLLHGSTQHARVWDRVAERLDGYSAMALDLRGHGETERSESYDPEDYLRDVDRAVDSLLADGAEGGRVALVGHSMGSLIAMRYAAERPQRVWATVFIDIDARVPEYQVETLHAAGARPVQAYETREEARERVAKRNPGAPDAVIERLVSAGFLQSDDGRCIEGYDRRTLAEFARWDNRALLPRITCPALVVRGGATIVHGEEAAREMVDALPDARFHELPGADHMLHVSHAEELASLLSAFLDEARSSETAPSA